MKITGIVLLVLVITAAIVAVLRVREVEHVRDDVARLAPRLGETGVEGTIMRRADALDRIEKLESLCAAPSEIAGSVPLLREIAAEAASWAAGSPSPSVELTAAVALRAAADTLREYAVRPSGGRLSKARAELLDAKSALEGFEPTESSTDALRDRIKNIDYSHREQFQELDEATGE